MVVLGLFFVRNTYKNIVCEKANKSKCDIQQLSIHFASALTRTSFLQNYRVHRREKQRSGILHMTKMRESSQLEGQLRDDE